MEMNASCLQIEISYFSVSNAIELFTHLAPRKIHDDRFAKSRQNMDRHTIHAVYQFRWTSNGRRSSSIFPRIFPRRNQLDWWKAIDQRFLSRHAATFSFNQGEPVPFHLMTMSTIKTALIFSVARIISTTVFFCWATLLMQWFHFMAKEWMLVSRIVRFSVNCWINIDRTTMKLWVNSAPLDGKMRMQCATWRCIITQRCVEEENDWVSSWTDGSWTINRVLSYFFLQMRDLVNRKSYRLRKSLDDFLFWLMPSVWVPLYNSVSFTHMPYKKCIENRKWQDKVIFNKSKSILNYGLNEMNLIGF